MSHFRDLNEKQRDPEKGSRKKEELLEKFRRCRTWNPLDTANERERERDEVHTAIFSKVLQETELWAEVVGLQAIMREIHKER